MSRTNARWYRHSSPGSLDDNEHTKHQASAQLDDRRVKTPYRLQQFICVTTPFAKATKG